MPANITYGQLFGLLRDLGFADLPTGKPDWAFRHAETDTLLVFSFIHAEADQVANADLVSAECFLRTKRFIAAPLVEVVMAAHTRRRLI